MSSDPQTALPLFPLQAVLFPGGLLSLKVFEARYLDLIGGCLRSRLPFGVVALRSGREVRQASRGGAESLEQVGVLAELVDVDSQQSGILQVRCRGTHRFSTTGLVQQSDGLWQAQVQRVADDLDAAPPETMSETVRALGSAIASLKEQGNEPFLSPHHFDSASWVANRWCEILPISIAAKQKLMELPDGLVRLQLVHDFLRSKGVVA